MGNSLTQTPEWLASCERIQKAEDLYHGMQERFRNRQHACLGGSRWKPDRAALKAAREEHDSAWRDHFAWLESL